MKFVIILLPLLLHFCDEILTSDAVLPNFYPFGQSEGDQLLPPNDDESSGTVPISIQFPFFDHNHNSLFVSRQTLFYFTRVLGSWYRKERAAKIMMKASICPTCSVWKMLVRFEAMQFNTPRH